MMLKERLGWEGGGLGKPEGWEERKAQAAREEIPMPQMQAEGRVEVVVTHEGRQVVDMTVDSDSAESDDELETFGQGGPGRTAPIATTLKLDRLGIGHRSRHSIVKQVTHTAKEIEAAQRRAKYGGRGREGLELGKKGKIKWKDRDRRERDDRRRLAAALNG